MRDDGVIYGEVLLYSVHIDLAGVCAKASSCRNSQVPESSLFLFRLCVSPYAGCLQHMNLQECKQGPCTASRYEMTADLYFYFYFLPLATLPSGYPPRGPSQPSALT
jgi:hypothetical protein